MESGRQKVTRKDVAREAGVSETIVSYVLNKNRYVKEEKRQRVLEVVEKLQYHPNNIARALHGKGSLQILFIAEELLSLIHIYNIDRSRNNRSYYRTWNENPFSGKQF